MGEEILLKNGSQCPTNYIDEANAFNNVCQETL